MTEPDAAVLLDASALIALLGGEPAAPEVESILRGGNAAMATLNLAEAVDRLERRYGLTSEEVRPTIDDLLGDALTLIQLTAAGAWGAARIRAAHYHRARCPISLADAVLVASAAGGHGVASSDRHVLAVAAKEGAAAVALPDSRGRRPRVRPRV